MNGGKGPGKLKSIILWAAAVILLLNSFVIQEYGDVIRSSYRFISSPLVFYPLATLNLIAGILVILVLLRGIFTKHKF